MIAMIDRRVLGGANAMRCRIIRGICKCEKEPVLR